MVTFAGIAARFASGKSLGTFIRAAAIVHSSLPATQFVAIGREDYPGGYRDLQQLIRRLNLTDSLRLIPALPRQDLIDAYRCLDVIAFTSTTLFETFGIVNLEAMAMRVPVVHFGTAGMQVTHSGRRRHLRSPLPVNVSNRANT